MSTRIYGLGNEKEQGLPKRYDKMKVAKMSGV